MGKGVAVEPVEPEEEEPLTPCQELATWNPCCRPTALAEGWTFRVIRRKHYDKLEKLTFFFSPR